MNNGPIGIFDSGIGGTSIWREINKILPYESTIYLADSRNAPYGEKSKEHILQLSIKNVELLLQQGCKLIVVACNTATTNAIKELRDIYTIPLIGIEPAIKPAALSSKTKTVGVLATKGTLSSALFHSTSELYAHGIKVLDQVGTGLVELIEKGEVQTAKTKELLQSYLEPMLEQGMDHLVLGCTHYPYLIPLIREILPENIKIIDSGEGVAKHTKNVLQLHQLLTGAEDESSSHRFFTNGDVEVLKFFLRDVIVPYRAAFLNF
ncbi:MULTISPECIES: glutamate racemase [unclassified Arenibacter]|uniref:glutamate racemase n=1 Tax=unclassified Arenibacter TaxID=2615047 RepID=UPI000E34BFC1|nr:MULTISPECIES: glutamate racemase [unclassified Arenibacter]MCM4164414.1 glutamate racemase [Arenibacter sp. A80]RFT56188.1 glutamate racemase [Arenibacter sp. P308M17]